jgi:zinc protease
MKSFLFYIALLLGCSHSFAQAEVFERTLANGLKVIVKEDHRAPVIVQQIWYKAGSMDERTGTTGIAHVLEHMMFKGTKSVPAGEFSRRIAAAGGRENAFTSNDYTAYFQQLHKSRLPLAMAGVGPDAQPEPFCDRVRQGSQSGYGGAPHAHR